MANTMRFVILGDDRASAAFDRFTRSVDKSSRAVDKSTASAKKQDSASKMLAKSTVGLTGTVSGFGAATDVMNKKRNVLVRGLAAADLATGVLESSISALIGTTIALAGSVVSAGAGLGAYGLAVKPVLGQVHALNTAFAAAAKGSAAAKKNYDLLLKNTPPQIVKFAKSVRDVQAVYKKWADSLATPVLAPLQKALTLVHPLLTAITPLATEGAAALHQLVNELGSKIQGGGLTNVVNTLLPHVRVSILNLAHATGNVIGGLWGIIKAFLPFSDSVSGGLVKLTRRFRDWASTLSGHTGFKALVAQWQQNWPLVKQGLESLLTILKNVASAMAGIATPANSKALWQVANPLLALAVSLSSHPDLVRALLYILLIAKGSGQVKTAFDAIKTGWGGVSRFLALVTGGKVGTGMQTAGDTMLTAATRMQAAADTMAGASGKAGVAGAAGGAAAGGARATIGRIALRAGLGALIIPATAMIVGSFIPKNKSAQVASDLKNSPGVVIKADNFLHLTNMGGWIDKYFSHPVRAWFENSLPHFASVGFTKAKSVISSAWDATWRVTLGRLVRFQQANTQIMGGLRHDIAGRFDGIRHDVAARWDQAWDATLSRARAGIGAVGGWLSTFRHRTASTYDGIRHDIAHAWDVIWSGTVARVRGGIGTVVGWFRTLRGRAVGALFGLGHALYGVAHAALTEFWNGLRSVSGSVLSWVGNFAKNIWSKVKSFFRVNSPSGLFFDIGKNLMLGLFHGIKNHAWKAAHAAQQAASGVAGALNVSPKGPVQSYARKLLDLYGWSGQWPAFNALVMSESGWRWNATNPSSGAYGIPQALPPGKMASAGADWMTSPYTQLRWMMAYIRSNTHFSDPNSAWAFHRANNWYGAGGPITEPIAGIGMRTGQSYGFGEAGSEHVVGQADLKTVAALLKILIDEIRKLHATTAAAPPKIAAGVGGHINGTSRSAALSR